MVKEAPVDIEDMVKKELENIDNSKMVHRLDETYEAQFIITNKTNNKTKAATVMLNELSKTMMEELILHMVYKLIEETKK